MTLKTPRCGLRAVLAAAALFVPLSAAQAGPAQDAVIAHYEQAAKAADADFQGFSAANGKAFFMANHTGGKPDTPSCTTCHTSNTAAAGQTRAGKPIDPMALSANPARYADLAKVEKWLARNCNSVVGRDCTPQESGDVLTFLIAQ